MKEVTTDKKYELTDETIEHNGRTLHRIRALRDFGSVKSDQLGGFVESEDNLSHEGDCWVFDEAKVYGNAKVQEDAIVLNNAEVYDNAIICDNASASGLSKAYNSATISGHARLYSRAKVFELAHVSGSATISYHAKVYGCASVSGSAQVYDTATVCGNAYVSDRVKVLDNATIDNARVDGNAVIAGDAKVCDITDYLVFKNWWSSGRYFTWTRSNNMWRAGCFYGTGEELIKKAKKDSPEKGREYERIVRYVESILANEEPTPVRDAIPEPTPAPIPDPTPVPTVEPPKAPSLEEVLGVVESLEDCSDSEIAKIVYDLATGARSLDDFNTWTIYISLYFDDNEVDHDRTTYTLRDIQSGGVDFDDFSLEYCSDNIKERVSDFLSDCISEWNGEDDGEFEESWEMDCNMGCSHNVRCEISIERD